MSFCPRCGAVANPDVRPVKADAAATFDLFEGARARGFSAAQIEYLGGCIGITWAKAYRAGQVNAIDPDMLCSCGAFRLFRPDGHFPWGGVLHSFAGCSPDPAALAPPEESPNPGPVT